MYDQPSRETLDPKPSKKFLVGDSFTTTGRWKHADKKYLKNLFEYSE